MFKSYKIFHFYPLEKFESVAYLKLLAHKEYTTISTRTLYSASFEFIEWASIAQLNRQYVQ